MIVKIIWLGKLIASHAETLINPFVVDTRDVTQRLVLRDNAKAVVEGDEGSIGTSWLSALFSFDFPFNPLIKAIQWKHNNYG